MTTHGVDIASANAATVVLPNTNAVAGTDATDTPDDVSTEPAQAPDMSAAIPQEDVVLEFHEFANIFPELTDDRLAELAQDIREQGLLDKIALYEDKILDGRGRYRACRMAEVEPEFDVFTGADPLAYVASRNQHRRDLDPSQRAMVAAKIANFKVGANQHSEENKMSKRLDVKSGQGRTREDRAVIRVTCADAHRFGRPAASWRLPRPTPVTSRAET